MTEIALPAGISLIDDPLPGLRVETSAATGTVLFNGAHVTEWTPSGHEPVIWVGNETQYVAGEAIRGGIFVVFPWFNFGYNTDREPIHGFARLAQWTPVRAEVSDKGTAHIILALDGPTVDLPGSDLYARDYRLEMHITMGETLQMQFVIAAGDSPLTVEAGLQTQLAVSDISNVTVTGLDECPYYDRVTDSRGTHHGDITFDGEHDKLYESTRNIHVIDEGWDRKLFIEKVNAALVSVWNPGKERSQQLPEFGPDEWSDMLGIATSNSRTRMVHLDAHERHLMSQTISIV